MFEIYDLEVLRNFFLYVGLSLKGETFEVFEISKFSNDLLKLVEHLKFVKGQIGFNCLSYDGQIQEYIIRNHKDWKEYDGEKISSIIYSYSQSVIERSNNNEWPDYNERNLSIRQLDLYRVWHYNNKARACSLKWLQYSMDYYNIEDMPIPHYTPIDDRETADSIINYCKNDCLSTREHYEVTIGNTENKLYKGINKVQLRKDVQKEFGFGCLNYSDVKIGDEIMKTNYCNATGIDYRELKKTTHEIPSFTFKDCLPEYEFKSPELIEAIERFKDVVINPDEEQKFPFIYCGVKYTFAKGGLHSKDESRIIRCQEGEILRDADVGSMYPNFIRKKRLFPRHLLPAWIDGYSHIIDLRLNAKAEYKRTKDPKYKSFDEAFKLALNGGSFGKTGERSSWQYDPLVSMKITIGCQIELLMLIEMLSLAGIRVISANTDGIVCLFNNSKEEEYYKICKEWEVRVGNDKMGMLEYADYKLFAQLSVNDYIAIKTDGSIKEKSSFMIDRELHKNKSFRIIALALESYFSKGINPTNYILEHQNIFDFCAGIRAKTDWYFETVSILGGEIKRERQQKTVRYFISNNGNKLMKYNIDGREMQTNAGKWLSTIYNIHTEKNISEYDINYDFYINEVYKIIKKIEPTVINKDYTQMSLF